MRIGFTVNYPTVWGQRLFVAGSSPGLGAWNVDNAAPMEYLPGDEWKCEIDLPSDAPAFEYKYLIRDDAGGTVWEAGHNRLLPSEARTFEHIDIRDEWRQSSDPESVFLSSAFTDAVFRREGPAGKAAKKGRATRAGRVHLRVYAPRIDPGDTLYVTGSIACLGAWTEAGAAEMDSSDYPLWKLDIPVGSSDIPFSYKYIIKDKAGRKVVYEDDEYRNVKVAAAGKGSRNIPRMIVVTDNRIQYAKRWRGAGIAVPVFSLRSAAGLGVGEFTDLKALVDWACRCSFRLIQLLPVNDTSATMMWRDSYPYANVSVFALHPIYLNLEATGQIPPKIAEEIAAKRKALNGYDHVNYEEVMAAKIALSRELFQRSKKSFLASEEFKQFFGENAHWLRPYAAFSALRDRHRTSDMAAWERYAKVTGADILSITSPDSSSFDDIAFYYYLQYHLHAQLLEASEYAKANNVVLKGDIPIGIHKHSDSCWLDPHLFHMDQSAGAPPDPFSDVGQNWGFPTYDWAAMAADGYLWWRRRLEKMSEYFQMARLDHVLGFFRIWEIPDTMTSGLMGHFNPAIPLGRDELEREGIWDFDRLCEPYIPLWLVRIVFGSAAQQAIAAFLEDAAPGHYRFKSDFNTQRKIEENIKAPEGAAADAAEAVKTIKAGLSYLVSNVCLFRDSERAGFHPRINMTDTPSFDCLDAWLKEKLVRLYNDYFYRRQEAFWRGQALTKLPVLTSASDMLICGEDLGMVPDCVGPVMQELCLLGLRIQRMPKEVGVEFSDPADYPYLTVCTTSSHDMSTIRGWWGEDSARSQRYYKTMLGGKGDAPSTCDERICEEIIRRHLESPSMWAVFPVQDILGMSAGLRRPGDPREEKINEPADPHHYWKFRLHLPVEKLNSAKEFSAKVAKMVAASGRSRSY